MKDPQIVNEFRKNTREFVQTVVREWNGRRVFDFRVCYQTAEGEKKPGPKGLCLRVELFADLKRAVLELEKVLSPK